MGDNAHLRLLRWTDKSLVLPVNLVEVGDFEFIFRQLLV